MSAPYVLTPISKQIQASKGMLLRVKRVKGGLQQRNGADSEQMRAVYFILFGPAYVLARKFICGADGSRK
jgi:tartrate dehydratase beta subunit/fumarate hydratase class I family protein